MYMSQSCHSIQRNYSYLVLASTVNKFCFFVNNM